MNQVSFVIAKALEFYTWLIIIQTLLSWVASPAMSMQGSKDSLFVDIYEVPTRLTEPVLALIRRVMPPMGGLDFSPMVAVIVLQIIRGFLI